MTRSTLLRLAGATVLTLALIGQPTFQPAGNAQSTQTYLALGDSVAAGLLASLPSERGYPALLHQFMETAQLGSDSPTSVELRSLAERGETVQSFRDGGQLDDALDVIGDTRSGDVRTITLTLGGNTILSLWESSADERQSELQQFQSDYEEVIAQLQSALEGRDTDVVVTTYYDLTEGDQDVEGSNAWWLREFNSVIRDAASEAGFTVVDLAQIFDGRTDMLTWFPADIHPNNAGHQVIAQAIWQELGYDEDAPEIEITRPESGDARNRTPTVHATVDDEVGVERVVLEVDGEEIRELLFIPDRGDWVGVWDARDTNATEAELTVTATDISGNESSDTVTISLPPS
ncbi:MAG: GDSL-type esterase/lipase family protein [Thermomicrobiaceae bacterium]